MRVIPLFPATTIAAGQTSTSAAVPLVWPRHSVVDAVGSDGFCSIQYVATGSLTFHFDFSHDGTTWVEGSSLVAGASGLEAVTIVYAPYMRVRATSAAGAPATVTASICV